MRIPDFAIPAALTRLLSHLPARPPAQLLVLGLNQLVRRGILPADMSLLAGHRFEVRILDAGMSLRLAATERMRAAVSFSIFRFISSSTLGAKGPTRTGCAAPAFGPGAMAATSAASRMKIPAEPARLPPGAT